MSEKLAEGCVDDSLDGVHPVLCLVEDDGLLGLEDFVGHFHLGDTELLGDVGADSGLGIVEGGQAMHEDGSGLGICHQLGIDLIGLEQLDTLFPDGIRLAHGNPNVGVDDIGVGGAFLDVLGQANTINY